MLNRCIAGFLHAGVRAAVWLYTHVTILGGTISRLVCRAARSAWSFLCSAWRRPIATAAVIVGIGFAWLLVGTTPLLSLTGSMLVGSWIGQVVYARLFGWLVRSKQREEPELPTQRNGRPTRSLSGVS